MKRLHYILPVLLVLALFTSLFLPAGAESGPWSYEDGSARGVTLTSTETSLTVNLSGLAGTDQFVVRLVIGTDGTNVENIVYMKQDTKDHLFVITPSASWIDRMDGKTLTLWITGGALTEPISLRVGYKTEVGGGEADPAPVEPTPTSTPNDDGYHPVSPPSSGGSTKPSNPQQPGSGQTFTDTVGHWSEAYISDAVARGLFEGYGNGRFGPDDPMTRAQFITVLWRMAGKPAAAAETPFEDIGGELDEYRAAIAWGYSEGYISGTTASRFDPSGLLTREQAMKILFYFNGGVSGDASNLASVYDRGYLDSAEISDWAKEAIYWGIYNRIISGVGDDILLPKGTATRAQLAKILIVYMDEVS